NAGSALGPLLAAFIILPFGQRSIAWFAGVALLAIILLARVSRWYKSHGSFALHAASGARSRGSRLPRRTVAYSLAGPVAPVFSKYFYLASITSYYTFFLIDKFHLSVRSAQLHLFVFLGAVAVGTIVGGPVGDRFGRKYVIWGSILGVLPFTLVLPYANLFWTR